MYTSFDKFFPEIAMEETKIIKVLDTESELPAGDYILRELYCSDKNCDCQRVMLNVVSHETKEDIATITLGFKNASFYRKWAGYDLSKKEITELIGPALNSFSSQSKYSNEALKFVSDTVLKDKDYIERLKRHYKMVKEVVDKKEEPIQNDKIGRNEMCPCGSGKKYKKCCYLKES